MKSREKKLMKTALLLVTVCVLVGSMCLTAGCIGDILPPSVASAVNPSYTGGSATTVTAYELSNPTLAVSSTPAGASVYLDGSYKGTTPLNITLMPNTRSNIEIRKNDYYSWTDVTPSLQKGQISSISATLRAIPNPILYVSSNPSGASVYLSGDYKGTTPLNLTLTPNTHSNIEIKKNGYTSWSGPSASMQKGESDSLSVTLQDLIIGKWGSDLGTSSLVINEGGKGTKTVLGFSESVKWVRVSDNTYSIDGASYTLLSSGNTLSGPIATYHRR